MIIPPGNVLNLSAEAIRTLKDPHFEELFVFVVHILLCILHALTIALRSVNSQQKCQEDARMNGKMERLYSSLFRLPGSGVDDTESKFANTSFAQCDVSVPALDVQLVVDRVAVGERGTSGRIGKKSLCPLSRDSVGEVGGRSRS